MISVFGKTVISYSGKTLNSIAIYSYDFCFIGFSNELEHTNIILHETSLSVAKTLSYMTT
jgi:hypothetical protein